MSDSLKQRNMHANNAERYYGSLAYAYAARGSEYGFSYYWWYYSIPTSHCHALVRST